jgi:hypothetical protein
MRNLEKFYESAISRCPRFTTCSTPSLRKKETRERGVMGDGRERAHTQSISFTGGVEFSFKYFQIG